MKRSGILCVLAVMALTLTTAQAELRASRIFSNNMVLQRDRAVPVWGWADPGATITVTFADRKETATADAKGAWSVQLKAMKAQREGQPLTISSSKDTRTLTIENVVVGDVWLCSGQSNMEWTIRQCAIPQEVAKTANYPLIRHVKFGKKTSVVPLDDVESAEGQWNVCSPKTVLHFTAVGYHFGRNLHEELDVPIGLIASNWGGTKVEPWTPAFAIRKHPELKGLHKHLDNLERRNPRTAAGRVYYGEQVDRVAQWVEQARGAVKAGTMLPGLPRIDDGRLGHQEPTGIYNAMIHPIVGYGIRGAIWYQGESNGSEGISYFHKKTALITGWRELWGYEFPFYFVQLANFRNPNNNPAGGDDWTRLREAQRKTLELPKTGMAVIIDIGEARDIHPKNKQDVGKRLAAWALANEYGMTRVHSGPLYKNMRVEGDRIRIAFDHVGSGLMVGAKDGMAPTTEVADGTLQRFAIAGEDKQWAWADAVIDGKTVVVSSPKVPAPVAVRYAFSQNPAGCNLYNKEGFPASPFRTDDW